jgi:osmotically-inducible protein OsmY
MRVNAMRLLSFLLAFLLVIQCAGLLSAQSSDDDRIYDEVRRRLANDPDVKGGAFEVDVKEGVVTVRGVVEKDKFKKKAERLVKKVKGVKGVVNQISVKGV